MRWGKYRGTLLITNHLRYHRWFKRGAVLGCPESTHNLATLESMGRGVASPPSKRETERETDRQRVRQRERQRERER